jgi:RHS repeat-associated protein
MTNRRLLRCCAELCATRYQWDAEGRLISVTNGAGTLRSSVYNALGREAEWHADGRVSEDLTDLAGNSVGGVDPSTGAWTGERIPGGRMELAWYVNGGTTFFHYNALGSTVMNTRQDGTVSNDIIFYPWGQVWTSPVNDYFQFFGSIPDWDWEINLGYTHARWYPLNHERWLSPDPAGLKAVKLADPQTWNMYAYVRNNPTTLTDPTGEYADYDVDKKNKTIRLKLSVGISGKGANVKVAQAMKARIESAWSGTYKDNAGVTWQIRTAASVQVVSRDRPAPGIENFLDLQLGQGASVFQPTVNKGTLMFPQYSGVLTHLAPFSHQVIRGLIRRHDWGG